MNIKSIIEKKSKACAALAEVDQKGVCAPETSAAIYALIDSDDIPASKKPRAGKAILTRKK